MRVQYQKFIMYRISIFTALQLLFFNLFRIQMDIHYGLKVLLQFHQIVTRMIIWWQSLLINQLITRSNVAPIISTWIQVKEVKDCLIIFSINIYVHSSEKIGLCSTFCSHKTLKNLPYLWKKKTQVVFFFHFSLWATLNFTL